MTTATAAGTYRLMEDETGYVDALAGIRFWDIKMDLGVNLNLVAGHVSDKGSWVDFLIGAKGRKNLSPNMYLTGWAMIGGNGGNSKFTWDVYGGLGYVLSHKFDAFAGFRAMGADYSKGTFKWDLTQYGPVLGFTLKL